MVPLVPTPIRLPPAAVAVARKLNDANSAATAEANVQQGPTTTTTRWAAAAAAISGPGSSAVPPASTAMCSSEIQTVGGGVSLPVAACFRFQLAEMPAAPAAATSGSAGAGAATSQATTAMATTTISTAIEAGQVVEVVPARRDATPAQLPSVQLVCVCQAMRPRKQQVQCPRCARMFLEASALRRHARSCACALRCAWLRRRLLRMHWIRLLAGQNAF